VNTTSLQSRTTVALTLAMGCCGTLVLGIQPLLLEALLAQGFLDNAGVGWVATAEVLSMAVGVLIGSRLLASAHAKPVVISCGIGMALGNLATLIAHTSITILLVRTVAGLTEGMMVAVAVMSISYSTAPGRLNAIFLTAGAAPQMLLAYVIPASLSPVFGPGVGFPIMAMAGGVCVALACAMKERFAPPLGSSGRRIEWSRSVVLVLLATLLTAAAIGACWSYAGPLAAEIGLNPERIGAAVTASLIFQLLGSLIVSVVGYRLSFRIALVGGALIQAAACVVLLQSHTFLAFTAALCIFGFLWQGCMPFAMDLVVSIDKSRATAPLILPLMFAGLSAGPFIASFWVGHSVAHAFWTGIIGFALALLVYMLVFRSRSATKPENLATSQGVQ
jgi:DHA1 family inner membrane transport protein